MSTSSPNKLKERIAALQQLQVAQPPPPSSIMSPTSASVAPISASSSTSPAPTGGLRAKIAKFEGMGTVPAPRGNFGLGPPPDTSSGTKSRELYGNRIPTPIRAMPTGLGVSPNSASPFSQPAPRKVSGGDYGFAPDLDVDTGGFPEGLGHFGGRGGGLSPQNTGSNPGSEFSRALAFAAALENNHGHGLTPQVTGSGSELVRGIESGPRATAFATAMEIAKKADLERKGRGLVMHRTGDGLAMHRTGDGSSPPGPGHSRTLSSTLGPAEYGDFDSMPPAIVVSSEEAARLGLDTSVPIYSHRPTPIDEEGSIPPSPSPNHVPEEMYLESPLFDAGSALSPSVHEEAQEPESPSPVLEPTSPIVAPQRVVVSEEPLFLAQDVPSVMHQETETEIHPPTPTLPTTATVTVDYIDDDDGEVPRADTPQSFRDEIPEDESVLTPQEQELRAPTPQSISIHVESLNHSQEPPRSLTPQSDFETPSPAEPTPNGLLDSYYESGPPSTSTSTPTSASADYSPDPLDLPDPLDSQKDKASAVPVPVVQSPSIITTPASPTLSAAKEDEDEDDDMDDDHELFSDDTPPLRRLPDVPPSVTVPQAQEEDYIESPPMSGKYIVMTPPVEEQAFLAFRAPAPAVVPGQDPNDTPPDVDSDVEDGTVQDHSPIVVPQTPPRRVRVLPTPPTSVDGVAPSPYLDAFPTEREERESRRARPVSMIVQSPTKDKAFQVASTSANVNVPSSALSPQETEFGTVTFGHKPSHSFSQASHARYTEPKYSTAEQGNVRSFNAVVHRRVTEKQSKVDRERERDTTGPVTPRKDRVLRASDMGVPPSPAPADLAMLLANAALLERRLADGELPSEAPFHPLPDVVLEDDAEKEEEEYGSPVPAQPRLREIKGRKRSFRNPRGKDKEKSGLNTESMLIPEARPRMKASNILRPATYFESPKSPPQREETPPPTPPPKSPTTTTRYLSGLKRFASVSVSGHGHGARNSVSTMSSSEDSMLVVTPPDHMYSSQFNTGAGSRDGVGARNGNGNGSVNWPAQALVSKKSSGSLSAFAEKVWNRSRTRAKSTSTGSMSSFAEATSEVEAEHGGRGSMSSGRPVMPPMPMTMPVRPSPGPGRSKSLHSVPTTSKSKSKSRPATTLEPEIAVQPPSHPPSPITVPSTSTSQPGELITQTRVLLPPEGNQSRPSSWISVASTSTTSGPGPSPLQDMFDFFPAVPSAPPVPALPQMYRRGEPPAYEEMGPGDKDMDFDPYAATTPRYATMPLSR